MASREAFMFVSGARASRSGRRTMMLRYAASRDCAVGDAPPDGRKVKFASVGQFFSRLYVRCTSRLAHSRVCHGHARGLALEDVSIALENVGGV